METNLKVTPYDRASVGRSTHAHGRSLHAHDRTPSRCWSSVQRWIQRIFTGRLPLAWTADHIKRPRHIKTFNSSRCVLLFAPSPPSLPCSRQCSLCWRLHSSATPYLATVSSLSASSTRSCLGPAAVAPGQFHDRIPCSLRCCRGCIKASAASVFFTKCRWAACT
jgi:hypothetical protein